MKPFKPSRYNKFIGKTYNKLTIVRIIGSYKNGGYLKPLVLCICECGNEYTAALSSVKFGSTKSCGCVRFGSKNALKHGLKRSSEYDAYFNAMKRCNDVNGKDYKNYGGRGIEFKFKSFQEFIIHIGLKPNPKLTLDRKENDGHYEIGNVRWATRVEQSLNTRRNKI